VATIGMAAGAWFVTQPARAADPPVALDWVTVGSPHNPPDTEVMAADRTTNYGRVDYTYEMSQFLVTNTQYAAFLNAVAKESDPYLLYHPCSPSLNCYGGGSGIVQSGAPGNYSYSVEPGRERRPANYMHLFDTLRFANWMNNGQGGPGTTEDGAYTLLGGTPVPTNAATLHRNPGAKIAVASENEWYKAAYYDGTKNVYYDWPTGTDEEMTCAVPEEHKPNTANCGLITGEQHPDDPNFWGRADVTDVDAYPTSLSPWGVYDMGGNLFQWTDTISYAVADQYHNGAQYAPLQDAVYGGVTGNPWKDGVGPIGILRGTDFGDGAEYSRSNGRTNDFSFYKWDTYGIRLVRLAQ